MVLDVVLGDEQHIEAERQVQAISKWYIRTTEAPNGHIVAYYYFFRRS